jgi:hydrogenase expression/formation protein HypD
VPSESEVKFYKEDAPVIMQRLHLIKPNQSDRSIVSLMEKKIIQDHLRAIARLAKEIHKPVTLMEICGGHTNVIMKYGIREILPKNIRLISGPGCPVCVSAQRDIDCVIALALQGIPIATYGDMLRVPGSRYSLDEARARGGKVYEIYSTTELLAVQAKDPGVVFFGVGFETTAPMTAFLLEHGISVYSVHKLIPPALRILAEGEMNVDGFLDPGHVSTIIGVQPYRDIKIPQVITGFSAEQIVRAIRLLLELIRDDSPMVINGYPEAVREEGNTQAQGLLSKHFSIVDSEWRGLGSLPLSGFEVKNRKLNAKIIYQKIISAVPQPNKTGCRCGDILRGSINPVDCPLYKKVCTPNTPQGACMVSAEGSCAIFYRYGK